MAVLVGTIVACSSIVESPTQEVQSDGGLLSGKPCSAPCFSSIIPGETSFDQVGLSLSKNGYDLSCKTSIDVDSRKVMSCKSGIWIGAAAKTNFEKRRMRASASRLVPQFPYMVRDVRPAHIAPEFAAAARTVASWS